MAAYTLIMILFVGGNGASSVALQIPQGSIHSCNSTKAELKAVYSNQVKSAYCINNSMGGITQ